MRKRVLNDILRLMGPVIGLEAFVNIVSGYIAIIIGSTIESFANSALDRSISDAKKSIWILVAMFLVSSIVIPLMVYIEKVIMFKQSLKHDRMIIGNFVDKSYDKSLSYSSGDISYKLEMDPINLRWIVIEVCTLSAEVVVVSIGLLYMIFRVNTLYAVVCLLVGFCPVIVAFFSGKLESKYELSKKEYDSEVRNVQADMCFNFLFIKLYGLKDIMIKRFSKLFSSYYEKTIKKYINCKAVTEFLNKVSGALAQITILLLGAYLVSRGNIAAGAVAGMMIYLSKVQDIYSKVGELIKKFILLPQCLDRVGELYMDKEVGGDLKIDGINSLVCEYVSFGFNDESKIFSNTSLNINRGEKVAIKGENGSGKSTLLKVLSGLYRNYGGKIKVNGENLRDVELKSLRKNISYMEQEPFIFKGSVYDNVALGNLGASKKEIEDCLEYTGLYELRDKNTETLGENLSGGEKQRISIARSLLKRSNFIFMDEPFNNLDSKGRELIEQILKDKEKTIVFITHDYELLKYGDRVVEM